MNADIVMVCVMSLITSRQGVDGVTSVCRKHLRQNPLVRACEQVGECGSSQTRLRVQFQAHHGGPKTVFH